MKMKNRYEFIYLFDVQDGNPNGDPDAGNLPRVDPETGHGLVTDVCLKRKVRNYVELTREGQPGFEIYVREKAVLNNQHERAYKEFDLKPEPKKLPKKIEDALRVTGWMCANFFDIRAFGAVMSTEVNCGQVRGPIQFSFARSVEPIIPLEHAITRMAVTNAADAEKKDREMGRKYTVPYGLYRGHGFVSPRLAQKTGFSDGDLDLFWEALQLMFDHDRSAARGLMAPRRLIVFKHENELGSAPAHVLFSLVTVARKDSSQPARSFGDYEVTVDSSSLPKGVEIVEKV